MKKIRWLAAVVVLIVSGFGITASSSVLRAEKKMNVEKEVSNDVTVESSAEESSSSASSSSFVVEITLRDVNGQSYSVQIPPDDPDGQCNGDLDCSATSIMNAKSVDALVELLASSADCGFESWDDDEDSYDGETKKAMQEFGEAVKAGISDINQISSIELTRTWYAWGEGASCFGANVEIFAEDLPELANAVLTSEGEDRAAAKEKLIDYLSHFPGSIDSEWGGCFPSNFLNQDISGSIVWEDFADSIEEFAQCVVDGELPNNDHAVETTEIDMQAHKITSKAEYLLEKSRW